MLKAYTYLLILAEAGILAACYPMNQIQNPTLRDKVYACGVIWGDSINGELAAQMDNHLQLHDGIQAGFQDEVKTIFDKLPPQDAEQSYKNYINCIETLKVVPVPAPRK